MHLDPFDEGSKISILREADAMKDFSKTIFDFQAVRSSTTAAGIKGNGLPPSGKIATQRAFTITCFSDLLIG